MRDAKGNLFTCIIPRFALDIDLDAPKIRIPIRTSASSEYESDFLLDFGNFTLRTQVCYLSHILCVYYLFSVHCFKIVLLQEEHHDNQEQNLYSRFCITGRDIAAFFADGSSDIQTRDVESSSQLSACHSYSLVDRCGIVVIVDQVHIRSFQFYKCNTSVTPCLIRLSIVCIN